MSIKGDSTQEAWKPMVATGWLCLLMTIFLFGCNTSSKPRSLAPLPPEFNDADVQIDNNKSEVIQHVSLNNAETVQKSCSFSSFQRKNTVGYEFNEATHMALRVSPSFDVWSMDDFKVKASVRFTHALGGSANKRPCTYGSGYYGLVPYFTHNEGTLSKIANPSAIKSMVQERIEDRETEKSTEY